MPDLTLVSAFEFESFLSVECDGNSKISQNVQELGFFSKKKDGSLPKTCMISVNVEAIVI